MIEKCGINICKSAYPDCVRIDIYHLGYGRYLRIGPIGCELKDLEGSGAGIVGVDLI